MSCWRKIYLLPLLCNFYICFSQPNEKNKLDSLAGSFIRSLRFNDNDAINIITNKAFYLSGETVWFRVFLTNKISNKINSKSKLIFLELVNEKDSVISQLILNPRDQKLSGSIALTETCSSGYYYIKAYTDQMLKYDPGSIIPKPIYILNRNKPDDTLVADGTKDAETSFDHSMPSVSFYPEGGSIITGAVSTVGVYVQTNSVNQGPISGYLKDSRDSINASFIVNENGLGKFSFYPSRFRKYTAYINWKGKEIPYHLPPFNFYAAQLSVVRENSGLRFLRVLLEDSIYSKNKVTYLLGICRDSLCFASLGTGMYETLLPEDKFPNGISTFYLLDEEGKLLSTRSVYIRHNSVQAILDKKMYKKREKVNLSIKFRDINDKPLPVIFSVNATDSSLMPGLTDSRFVRSCINNKNCLPEYSHLTDDDLDLLMLTRKENLQRNTVHGLENYSDKMGDSILGIKGQLVDLNNNPVPNRVITLLSISGKYNFETDTSDANGRFYFDEQSYSDSTLFSLQVANSSGDIRIIQYPQAQPHYVNKEGLKQYREYSHADLYTAMHYTSDSTYIFNKDWMKPVIVKTYRKPEVNYDEKKRISALSYVLSHDRFDKGGVSSVANAILTIPGVSLVNGKLSVGGSIGMHGPQEPILVIDGIQITTLDSGAGGYSSPLLSQLSAINPYDIDFIEVLKGPEAAAFGVRGGNGVILINTRSQADPLASKSNIIRFYKRGFHVPREFQMPDYDLSKDKLSKYPDNRSTLYWNSNVISPTGDVNLGFYTSDIPGVYQITIDGLSVYGDRIYKTLVFEVK